MILEKCFEMENDQGCYYIIIKRTCKWVFVEFGFI